jgi:hypothetical protein
MARRHMGEKAMTDEDDELFRTLAEIRRKASKELHARLDELEKRKLSPKDLETLKQLRLDLYKRLGPRKDLH